MKHVVNAIIVFGCTKLALHFGMDWQSWFGGLLVGTVSGTILTGWPKDSA
jgi:hypothetical protein